MISSIFQFLKARFLSPRGNILVYIVMTMVIFGVLAVTMLSLFSTSISSTATQNDTRRAMYLSEAGSRYAMSELLTADFSETTINNLNATTYSVNPAGQFNINVFSPWFELNLVDPTAVDYDFVRDGNSIPLQVAEGQLPQGFFETIQAAESNLFLVNYDYFTTTPSPPPDPAISVINAHTVGTPTTFQYSLAEDFVAAKREQICMAVSPFSGGQAIPLSQDYLDLVPAAKKIFPPLGGAFEVQRRNFLYTKRDDSLGDRVRLTGIYKVAGEKLSGDITVAAEDPVILSPRNRLIVTRGRSGEVEFGDHMNFATGFADISVLPPEALKPDIEFDEEADLPGVLSQVEQNLGVVDVYNDPGNKYITLSTSGGSFGAFWFRDPESRSIGGVRNFCNNTGGCLFNIGFRAFFILTFTGSSDGDGLTFSIVNHSNNNVGSVGGDIDLSELLAYAGDSRTVSSPTGASDFLDGRGGQGLLAPKMAVEFDGRRNTQSQTICQNSSTVNLGSRFDPDFSGSDRDVVQYVFWGKDSLINAPCRINPLTGTNKTYDDNRHDAVTEIWSRPSGSLKVSSPAVDGSDPANVKIYTGRSSETTRTDDGRLIRWNPSNGDQVWTENPDTTAGNDDDIDSPPSLDSSGNIYVGNDSFLISRYNSSGTKIWSTPLVGNIEVKPFVSEIKDRVYVVADRSPSFPARLYSLDRSGAVQWFFDIGLTNGDYTSSPMVRYDSDLDKNIIYVGSLNNNLYVVRDDGGAPFLIRQFALPSLPIRSTPAINPVTNDVYFGSDDNNIYAITSAGNGRWSVGTGGDVVSSPAVTGNGRTVYVGSNNGRLYIIALNADGSLDNVNSKTYPPTSDSPIGAIQSSPTIAGDGAILFGSDDGHLYALNPDGTLRWKFPAVGSIAAVRSKPAIGPDGIIYFGADDGKLYAIDPAVNDPANIPNLYLTSAELGAGVTDANNWFMEGPWAVRLEVLRSTTPNGSGKYEYTMKAWLKKCQDANCLQEDATGLNVVGGFFQNTRFEYDWTNAGIAPMTQTIELSNVPDSFHDRFDRFLFGFTSASTASQTIEIRRFQLSFIRPNDPVAKD